MITREQIEIAAEIERDIAVERGSSWIAAMARKNGFEAGAKWAIDQMKAGNIIVTKKPTLSKR
jgi:hypothetical protein